VREKRALPARSYGQRRGDLTKEPLRQKQRDSPKFGNWNVLTSFHATLYPFPGSTPVSGGGRCKSNRSSALDERIDSVCRVSWHRAIPKRTTAVWQRFSIMSRRSSIF
jgi:hypothetical protein